MHDVERELLIVGAWAVQPGSLKGSKRHTKHLGSEHGSLGKDDDPPIS